MPGRGKLKIYFGYTSGVGKTYAMLKDAHQDLRRGTDIIVGYVDPRSGLETIELTEGLELLPLKIIKGKNGSRSEFNLEGALFRKPQVILVDEFAHANAVGARHEKRYQDIEELLQAGVDVWTTLNVFQIESLYKSLSSRVGPISGESLPDFIFDCAERVELIDLDPEELVRRYQEGKWRRNGMTQTRVRSTLRRKNLDMLRSLAIKRSTERLNQACNWI